MKVSWDNWCLIVKMHCSGHFSCPSHGWCCGGIALAPCDFCSWSRVSGPDHSDSLEDVKVVEFVVLKEERVVLSWCSLRKGYVLSLLFDNHCEGLDIILHQ